MVGCEDLGFWMRRDWGGVRDLGDWSLEMMRDFEKIMRVVKMFRWSVVML